MDSLTMIGSARLTLAFILTLASVIQGEAGVVLELAGPAVGRVAMNNVAIGKEFGPWHGYAEPSDRAVEMAWEAYREGSTPDGDIHAISGADMEALGFDKANWQQVGSEKWPVWVGRDWR